MITPGPKQKPALHEKRLFLMGHVNLQRCKVKSRKQATVFHTLQKQGGKKAKKDKEKQTKEKILCVTMLIVKHNSCKENDAIGVSKRNEAPGSP